MAGPKAQVALINAKIGATLNSTLNEYTVDCSTVNSLPGNFVIYEMDFFIHDRITCDLYYKIFQSRSIVERSF